MKNGNTNTSTRTVAGSAPQAVAIASDGWATHLRAAVISTIVLVVIVSGIYPAIVWGISQALFHHRANGSLIHASDGATVIGSELIGQQFTGEQYFHPRPSAAGSGYDPSSSGGTNLGPTSDKLLNGIADDPATKDVDESYAGVKQLAEAYRKTNGLPADAVVPADAVTRSASGVDPHISPENARLQLARVARFRGIAETDIRKLIDKNTDGRAFGILGEPGVNVFKLNLAMDRLRK